MLRSWNTLSGPILTNLTGSATDTSQSYFSTSGLRSAIDFSHNQLTSLPSIWLVSEYLECLDLSHNEIRGANTSSWPWFYYAEYLGDDLQVKTFSQLRLDNNRIEGPLTTLPPTGSAYLFNNSLEGRWGAFSTGRHGLPGNTPHCLREEPMLNY